MRCLPKWLGLLVLFCWLNGCSAPAATAPVPLVVAGTDELRFVPAELSAPAGATIDLTFRNEGKLQHSFAIIDNGAEINLFTINQENFAGEIDTGQVDGGASVHLTIPPLDPATYSYVCLTPGHAAAGMVGQLSVTAPDN